MATNSPREIRKSQIKRKRGNDMAQMALVDPETERAEKLHRYYRHFNVLIRYKLTFREFVAKVDAGTWNPYLAGR